MLPGYIVFASCHPSSTAARWTRRDPQTPRPSKSCARAQAGTLLAVHADWAQGHLVRQHQPPAALQGYVGHISITMPDSMPLHTMAVYQPQWRDVANNPSADHSIHQDCHCIGARSGRFRDACGRLERRAADAVRWRMCLHSEQRGAVFKGMQDERRVADLRGLPAGQPG